MEVTLDLILASRDARWQHQQELLQQHPDLTLVCLTVVMPGKVKRNDASLIVAHAAVEALKQEFGQQVASIEERDLPTGFEAYLLCTAELLDAKRRVCQIEETHPLGRLFDLDVIHPDGTPISRTELGLPNRSCIICGNEARYCMRNHTHTQEELQAHIANLIADYVHRV